MSFNFKSNDLPEQVISPFHLKMKQKLAEKEKLAELEKEAQQKLKTGSPVVRSRALIEGGQDTAMEKDDSNTDLEKDEADMTPMELRDLYLKRASAMNLNDLNIDEFFLEEKLHYTFGVQSKLYMRLGNDSENNVFKVYLKKDNSSSKPSIIPFILSEMGEVKSYMMDYEKSIEEGLALGSPFMKPATMVGFKLEQPTDNLDFWLHDSVQYTSSGHIRMRLMYQPGSVYMLHINQAKEPGVKFQKYCGPKVRLNRKEVADFLRIYEEILLKTGPIANFI